MVDAVRVYQRLPYPLRVVAASARGWCLRRSRVGRDTPRFVEEALERDRWSAQRLASFSGARLAETLDHAARSVPYYREHWNERRRRGDRAGWEVLSNWPVLKKADLRARPEAFLADDGSARRSIALHTSGTTGTPLRLFRSREANVAWYALFEARVHRWNGVGPQDRWAILGGQLVASVSETSPPFWVWNMAMGQLYLSSYHVSARNVSAYLEAMRRHRVRCVEGYPSAMHALASETLRAGGKVPELLLAVSNAEPLFDAQRATIGSAFRCPVRDTYGMTEIASGASECERGALHLWPEAGVVEVLAGDDDLPVAPGTVGRLVCTGLLNRAMPLIRYEVGDRGAIAASAGDCPCGRSLPVLATVEGRMDDVIVTPDGRRVGRLDPVFKGDIPIVEAQIIQEAEARIRVRFVPAPGFAASDRARLERRLTDRLGPMEITLDPVERIERSANGKFRAVVSRLAKASEQRTTDGLDQ